MSATIAEPRASPAGWLWLAVACTLAAGLSVLATGFRFGIGNNVFHIPYVLNLAALPQFEGDAFYASLDSFVSVIWLLVRGLANDDNVATLFLVAHVLSRLAAFGALGVFLIAAGLRRRAAFAAALLLYAATPWLDGLSVVGGHGLFIATFTHSEATWGPMLAALVALRAGRLHLAALLAAAVIAINVFVGVWFCFAVLVACGWARRELPGGAQLAAPALSFVVLCMPMAAWVAWAAKDGTVGFSYAQYIRTYFPDHFLVESASPAHLLALAGFFGIALVAAVQLRSAGVWTGLVVGFAVLVAIGAALPYALDARWVFNLHLLRAAGVVQFLAVVFAVPVALNALLEREASIDKAIAAAALLPILLPVSLVGLFVTVASLTALACTRGARPDALAHRLAGGARGPAGRVLLVALLGVVAAKAASAVGYRGLSLAPAAFAVVLAGLIVVPVAATRVLVVALAGLAVSTAAVTVQRSAASEAERARKAEADAPFLELTSWVRSRQERGVFLVPLDEPFSRFQHLALRPVWVEWKQGAAVMWRSRFHEQWWPRFHEVRALRTDAERLAYARRHHVRWVVLRSAECPTGAPTVFRNARFVICEALP